MIDLPNQLIRPSSRFSDCETAHMFMCEGCPEEHGWSAASDMEPDTPVCCKWMSFADFDKPVCVELGDGSIQCIGRVGAAIDEYGKYLERMI